MKIFVTMNIKYKRLMVPQLKRSLLDKEIGSATCARIITIRLEVLAIGARYSFEIKMIFLHTRKIKQKA